MVGGVYAANTLGAILGALAISLVLVPWIGTRESERVLVALSAVGALVVLAPRVARSRARAPGRRALAAALVVAACSPGASIRFPAS